jgi:succinate dehydrogenase/fumarate reductase flavoprotein subunit
MALQAQTGRNLMVLRNRDGLLSVQATIARLRAEELPYLAVGTAPSLRRALEAENTLLVADLMALAALTREESRGSHFREDYPEQDDDRWRVNVLLCATDGQIEVSLVSLASSDRPGQ